MGIGWKKGTELGHTPSFLFLVFMVHTEGYVTCICTVKNNNKTNHYVPNTQVNEENVSSVSETCVPLPDTVSPKEPPS